MVERLDSTPTSSSQTTPTMTIQYFLLIKVLRFYGYYKESVPESKMENSRVRNLVLFFYVTDNTISICEPKQMNSGIPQGTFLRRQHIPNPNQPKRFYNAYDLKVGDYIEIYGKNIKLVDCDLFTRDFYSHLGLQQPIGQQAETDVFQSTVLPSFKPKEWSGLNSGVLNGRVPSQKQFLANDRKVLRFYVHSREPYILHYYLADDTMEVREVNYPNSGKSSNFSLLLRRQKFPKKFSQLTQPGGAVEQEYFRDTDIRPGQIEIFNRVFQVNGCDKFTHDYYMEKYGFDFPISKLNFDDDLNRVEVKIPPYNGFGDEEDSLSNVNKLIPKPPKKDYFKWVDNQIQLRFNALMVTDKPEDVGRKFIITLFMNDDTVMVYEPQVRNSGIVSGKFLERMKYKNKVEGGRFFVPQDFLMGKTVQINGYKFRVFDQDERTKVWLEQTLGVSCAAPHGHDQQNGCQTQGQQWQPQGQCGQGQHPQCGVGESAAWQEFQNQAPLSQPRGWEEGPYSGQNPGNQGAPGNQYQTQPSPPGNNQYSQPNNHPNTTSPTVNRQGPNPGPSKNPGTGDVMDSIYGTKPVAPANGPTRR
jgi:hypothetical protein